MPLALLYLNLRAPTGLSNPSCLTLSIGAPQARLSASFHLRPPSTMAAAPQLLPTLFPAVAAVLTLLLASAPPTRAHGSYRCGWCPRRSTASILPPDAGVLTGAACGYGGQAAAAEMAVDAGFHIAAVSAGFFSKGRACGACYQLRCRGRSACSEGGVKVVVVTDVAETNVTRGGRFLLTKDAFIAMTRPDVGLAASMDSAIDVDFRRIPCAYKNKNLAVRIEETSSRERGHLALRFLYQGGQTDIAAVEVAQAVTGSSGNNNEAVPAQTSWQYMTRREGSPSVWRRSRVPAGPLQLRLVVTAGSGGKWLRADRAGLPAEWQPGAVYDTGLRVTDVAANTCGGASCSAMDEGDDDEQLR